MTNFINLLNKALNMLGLIISPVLVKLLSAFYRQAEQGGMIPAALLRGVPGAGKTSTAEAFALAVGAQKFFYQCNPGTGKDELIGQPNLAAVLHQDSEHAISDGILIQAVKAAIAGEDVVLILDEIDKSSPEVDSYLLDFLQSRRIHDSTMAELIIPTDVKFWVFMTSNNERDLSDALMRRVKRFNVERPSRSTIAEVLGIAEDAALLDIWQSCESLAISQMKQYLQDGGDPEDIDADLLGQYIDDLPDLDLTPGDTAEAVNIQPVSIIATVDADKTEALTGFKWIPRRDGYSNSVLIEIPTLTEYLRVRNALAGGCYRVMDEETRFIQLDWLKPVVENKDGGIFVVDDDIVIVASRKADGKLYISGEEMYHLADRWLDKLVEKYYREVIFKAKQAENLREVRKVAAVSQAAHILAGLGLNELI